MSGLEQKVVDTRALEIAGRALVLIERHERDCGRQRAEDREAEDAFREGSAGGLPRALPQALDGRGQPDRRVRYPVGPRHGLAVIHMTRRTTP